MKKLVFFFAVCFLFMMTAASLKVIAQPSTDINTYVLFALDRLSFKGGSQSAGWGIVYGNLGVNNAAATAKTISLEFATSGFAYMADGYQAVGDHVRGDAGGSFYDLYANKLGGNFGAEIRNLGPLPITSFPVIATLPVFPFTPNRVLTNTAPDLTIPVGAVVTITTTPLRDVKIKDHAIVTFGPGVFDMRKVDIGKFVTFIVDNNTILQIDQTFQPNNNFQFGNGIDNPMGPTMPRIYVGAYGLDWTTTTVTNFSHYSEIHANYYSPDGWLDIGGKNELFGHFWARVVSGDKNNNVYWICQTADCVPTFPCPDFKNLPSVLLDINGYVLFAYEQLEWKGGVLANGWGYIYGNIGVDQPSSTISNHFSLIFGSSKGAWMGDGYQAVADFVRGDNGASFYDLYANTLNNNFGADIRHWGPLATAFPLSSNGLNLPALSNTAGVNTYLGFDPCRDLSAAPDLTIGQGVTATITTTPLRDLRINDDAIVTFGPGIFDMRNFDAGKNVTIIVDPLTILQINEKFKKNDDFTFGAPGTETAKIYVGSCGLSDVTPTTPTSRRNTIYASYFAPYGILDLGANSIWTGHFWARRITGDPNNFVTLPPCPDDSPLLGLTNPGVKASGIPISIFPNPAKESCTLQINNSINQGSTLTLSDLTGKEILHTALQLQEGVSNYPVNIAGITPGVYIVRLQTSTGVGQAKIIINR